MTQPARALRLTHRDGLPERPRILLVEDNPGDAMLARERLSDEPTSTFDLLHVTSLSEAISTLEGCAVDAVLLDLELPDSSGLSTLSQIRDIAGDAPVIVVSGSVDEIFRQHALGSGAYEAISKADSKGRLFSRSVWQVVKASRTEEQQRQLSRLFAAIPDAIVVTSTDGFVRFVNDAAIELLGRSRDEVVGAMLEPHAILGVPFEVGLTRRGAKRTCEVRVLPFDWYGEPALLGLVRDLTRMPESQRQIASIRARRHDRAGTRREDGGSPPLDDGVLWSVPGQLLDLVHAMVVAVDASGRITLVNRRACDVLGWSAEELIGTNWAATCVPPEFLDAESGTLAGLLRDPVVVTECTLIARDGSQRLIEWHHTAVRDEEGNHIGTLSSGIDITDASAELTALRCAEERIRLALETANVGIWDLEFSTGALRMSPLARAHYGMSADDEETLDALVKRLHPDDGRHFIEALRRAMSSDGHFSIQHRVLLADRSTRWVTSAGRLLPGAFGEPARCVAASIDSSNHHKLEEQFLQAQKLETVGRLVGGVSHDFNNLLTIILGYCDLMLPELHPTDACREDVATIRAAAGRAVVLTRQLLDYSRKKGMTPTVADVNEVVDGLSTMLQRLMPEDIVFAVDVCPEPCRVLMDRGQLEQIIVNLAVNARDAMPMGGTLSISTCRIGPDHPSACGLRDRATGPVVVLTVADSGVGMTAEVQRQAFEPFFTTKEPGRGTGLGLAMVHDIVGQAGGYIRLESTVGQGTSLALHFHLADDGVRGPEPVSKRTPAPGGGRKVLVVEDDASLRELARKVLVRHGYRVAVAATAEEADAHLLEDPSISLLIADVVLHKESGPHLGLRLLAERPDLKVILVSGHPDAMMRVHGTFGTPFALLRKPFTPESLTQIVGDALTDER